MNVNYAIRDGVALIVIDNPPVNSISAAVRVAIASALEQAQRDPEVVAAVLMGGGKVFCGGAEVREFNTPFQLQKPTLPELNALQDTFRKPLVAAIAGFALGGGLELALGCHWRVANADARLGLPEVNLGLMPGSGGSQRLPRLMAITPALKMMVTGEAIDARRAYAQGLVDALAEGDLQDAAVAFARQVAQREDRGIRRVRDLPIRSGARAADELRDFRRTHPVTARSPKGVQHVIDACEAAVTLPFEQGLLLERERFLRLLAGAEFKALSHAFFALRQARKVEGLSSPPHALASVAFVGVDDATTRLAEALTRSGVRATVVDGAEDAKLSAIAGHELIVLAMGGNRESRRALLQEIARHTSTQSIVAVTCPLSEFDGLAAAGTRVLGLHTPGMKPGTGLLEIVRGPRSSPEDLSSVLHLGRMLGCATVLSWGVHGAIGQRMMRSYLQQAQALLEEGCTPHQVDSAMEEWGMASGPFALDDSLGLQQFCCEGPEYGKREDHAGLPGIRQKLLEKGRRGLRTGSGWYAYEGDRKLRQVDVHVRQLLVQHRAEIGVAPRPVADDEIVSRLTLALANAGGELLDEGVTAHASNIDAVWLAGYGFPASRGGPLFNFQAPGASSKGTQ